MTSAVTIPRHGGTGGRTAVAARARQVVKAYGAGETRVVALDHVDVDIMRGQFTAIIGPFAPIWRAESIEASNPERRSITARHSANEG